MSILTKVDRSQFRPNRCYQASAFESSTTFTLTELKQFHPNQAIFQPIHHFNEQPRFGNYSKFFHMKF